MLRWLQARLRPGVVLLGAVFVAVLDLAFAMLFWAGRVPPIRMLHSIAAGLLGRTASIAGGTGTALLGGVLHVAIATTMAFVYAATARRFPTLVRHPTALGAVYGVLLYVTMNLVVMPLSAVGKPSFANHTWIAASLAMHVIFGIVFAHVARVALRDTLIDQA